MTIFLHELKRNKLSLILWSAIVSFMLGICILIYPDMSSQMGQISDMFANMGSFTDAFGMDQVNFGEFSGYFAIECGNVLGMGGAFFAAILGISALSKEERDKTGEFLLTHPISRYQIISEKLFSVITQITLLNLIVLIVSILCILIIGEAASYKTLLLLFLSYYLLQLEIACITFGISAFLRGSSLGIGLALATGFYFLNIISNLTEKVEFLKFITPFAYADGAQITSTQSLAVKYFIPGCIYAIIGVAAAYYQYPKKDIT
ncbi:MAG: ABC transporter permease [Ruminococcaceae bacterium]|nr:ABC transporter permease [Oscillospiraceae bacterium]